MYLDQQLLLGGAHELSLHRVHLINNVDAHGGYLWLRFAHRMLALQGIRIDAVFNGDNQRCFLLVTPEPKIGICLIEMRTGHDQFQMTMDFVLAAEILIPTTRCKFVASEPSTTEFNL